MATSSTPTVTPSSGVDTLSVPSGVDTVAQFYYGSDLTPTSASLSYASITPVISSGNYASAINTTDSDGALTNYQGSFLLDANNNLLSGTVYSFSGSDASGKQFAFASHQGFDATTLFNSIKSNNTTAFFNQLFSGNDSIVGSYQDDVLSANGGNNTIDGGAGYDRVFFSGKYADYQFTPASTANVSSGALANSYLIVKNNTTSETNYLINVEALQFTDKTIATSSIKAPVTPPPTPTPTPSNAITLSQPNAIVSNTQNTNASSVTSSSDDNIVSSVANLIGSSIDGGAGNDTLTLSDVANSLIIGSNGIVKLATAAITPVNIETLQLANGDNNVTVLPSLTGLSSYSIPTVLGGTGNDTIIDQVPNSSINGADGNDTIVMGGNNDTVTGGSGKDTIAMQQVAGLYATSGFNMVSSATVTDFVSGTDKFDFSNNVIPVIPTSIIGAWKTTTALGTAVTTFLEDGTYYYGDSQSNAEKGTYSWNSINNTFTVTGNTFNQGSLGFYPSNAAIPVTFNGNTASWTINGVPMTATPITDATPSTNSIIGSWQTIGQSGGDTVVTVLADGTYYLIDNGNTASDPTVLQGMEKGTYTWNPVTTDNTGLLTGSLSITPPTINTDGQGGFSYLTATEQAALSSIRISGNTLFFGTRTSTKVVDPMSYYNNQNNVPVLFDGNQPTFALAKAALKANSSTLQVVYEQDTHTLWVDTNNDGVLTSNDPMMNNDLQIKLSNNPANLTAADVTSALATTGNSITLNAPSASVNNFYKLHVDHFTTAGNDTITSTIANLSNSTIDGGAGSDTLVLSDVASSLLTVTNFSQFATNGVVNNIETLKLADGQNKVVITALSMSGIGSGAGLISTVIGGSGNDAITDFNSNSSITGGAGDDTILAAGSNDTITGGLGKDTFIFNASDVGSDNITDFVPATDRLAFAASNQLQLEYSSSANTLTFATVSFDGNTPTFAGVMPMQSGTAVHVVFEVDTHTLWVHSPISGYLQIVLNGVTSLAQSDFA